MHIMHCMRTRHCMLSAASINVVIAPLSHLMSICSLAPTEWHFPGRKFSSSVQTSCRGLAFQHKHEYSRCYACVMYCYTALMTTHNNRR